MGEPCKNCGNCAHFRRHYVRVGNHQYLPLDQGHCVRPRLKGRTAQTPACQCYREKKGG